MLNIRIGVVGNCVAGKSTLVTALRDKGYNAVNIPQEHSVSKKFWRRLTPDVIIYLRCTLETARQRRRIPWGQERLDEQWELLAEVREAAHIMILTDALTKEQVLAVAEQALSQYTQKEIN
ncbi:MAG: hypothetical protein FD169_473 [Bacillota bacterium]|nr:MAG: hypothetical protein FD169_473 [Bacillota bacterium]MBS3950124.1 hypothetical protein [Peptococcaceae bacterium]